MSIVTVACPNCGQQGEIDAKYLGKNARCKKCNTSFRLQVADTPRNQVIPELKPWTIGESLGPGLVVEKELGRGGFGIVYLVKNTFSREWFAVKRVDPTKEFTRAKRRAFIAELITWIDLPAHPNLTACHFFQMPGDEFRIFAEYVPGGSLADWIRNGKLTRLEDMLRVAIHSATGLSFAHKCDLIHCDIKPGNLLMTSDGGVKITDFGIALMRQEGDDSRLGGKRNPFTPSYCSPEQRKGERLTHQTDIWSWGVTLIDLFAGNVGVCEGCGEDALEVLDTYLAGDLKEQDDELPEMPNTLVQVLRRAFEKDRRRRWGDMGEVVEALCAVYKEATGKPYQEEVALEPKPRKKINHDRSTPGGIMWCDPREWLQKVLEAANRPVNELASLLPPSGFTRKAQAIADVAVFDEARRRYLELMSSGREDLERVLAALCTHQAWAHEGAGDTASTLDLYDQSITHWQEVAKRDGSAESSANVAIAHWNKGCRLNELNQYTEALSAFDQAIEMLTPLAEHGNSDDPADNLTHKLGVIYTNKGMAHSSLCDYEMAYSSCDHAIVLLRTLVESDRDGEIVIHPDEPEKLRQPSFAAWLARGNNAKLAIDFAFTYNCMGSVLCEWDKHMAALVHCNRSINLYECLIGAGCRSLLPILGMAYGNLANVLMRCRQAGAVGVYQKAVAVLQPLVIEQQYYHIADKLALAYTNLAVMVLQLEGPHAAIEWNERAVNLWSELVLRQNRSEWEANLAIAYEYMAFTLAAGGRHSDALPWFDRSLAIFNREQNAGRIAGAGFHRAKSLIAIGQRQKARSEVVRYIRMLEDELHRTGRPDLERLLGWARETFAELE